MCLMYPLFSNSVSEMLFNVSLSNLLQYVAKYKKGSENPSSRTVLTFHVFSQRSHLVAVRQGLCCSCLTYSCKEALSRFLKVREKYQTDKKIKQ
jgi:hypothetical protein